LESPVHGHWQNPGGDHDDGKDEHGLESKQAVSQRRESNHEANQEVEDCDAEGDCDEGLFFPLQENHGAMDDAEQERIKDFTRRKHSGIFFFSDSKIVLQLSLTDHWKYSFPEMKPS